MQNREDGGSPFFWIPGSSDFWCVRVLGGRGPTISNIRWFSRESVNCGGRSEGTGQRWISSSIAENTTSTGRVGGPQKAVPRFESLRSGWGGKKGFKAGSATLARIRSRIMRGSFTWAGILFFIFYFYFFTVFSFLLLAYLVFLVAAQWSL